MYIPRKFLAHKLHRFSSVDGERIRKPRLGIRDEVSRQPNGSIKSPWGFDECQTWNGISCSQCLTQSPFLDWDTDWGPVSQAWQSISMQHAILWSQDLGPFVWRSIEAGSKSHESVWWTLTNIRAGWRASSDDRGKVDLLNRGVAGPRELQNQSDDLPYYWAAYKCFVEDMEMLLGCMGKGNLPHAETT